MQPLQNKHRKAPEATAILHAGLPLLDVRAPMEFEQGAIPNSFNHAILTDAERAEVGRTYKQEGGVAATALGHKLVSGDRKTARLQAWAAYLDTHPNAMVMCWRGGQRSQIAQQWLQALGYTIERVPGGYKRLRNACIETLELATQQAKPWWVVAGRTGVQKTILIQNLNSSIDLEGLAHHRGSAFGAYATPQPAPASFENHLAVTYLQHNQPILVLEDESRTIGRLALPGNWHSRMQQSPLVLLEADLEARVAHIVAEYVTQALHNETAEVLEKRYRGALSRIERRLGGALYKRIDQLLADAFSGASSHEAWVHALLSGYYDPMYDYQLRHKAARIKFTGPLEDIEAFLTDQASG